MIYDFMRLLFTVCGATQMQYRMHQHHLYFLKNNITYSN